MRLAFIDTYPAAYDPSTVYSRALGGMQSAVCYLTAELANLGHEVLLLNNITEMEKSLGVLCCPLPKSKDVITNISSKFKPHIIIGVMGAEIANSFRSHCLIDSKWVLWTGHSCDQPSSAALKENSIRNKWDAFAFVGTWQMERYLDVFDLNANCCINLGHGFSKAFENLFSKETKILTAKSDPPTLAYTSAPYMGLHLLIYAFPKIKAAIPNVKLKVFSDMTRYDQPEFDELKQIFEFAESIEGIELCGSIPQAQLALELRAASLFAYPNSFPETHCIALREGLAAGCLAVTTDLGALPETSGGYAVLIPNHKDSNDYIEAFSEKTISELRRIKEHPESVEQQLRSQLDWLHAHHTWAHNAKGWESWLEQLTLGK